MKNKVFIACDSTNINKIRNIIKETKNSHLKVGYKFGLEFLNSKNGRKFVAKLRDKITFGDYKFNDIPNTCASAIKSISDLKFNYITIHISAGLEALKAAKKVVGKTKLVGVSILTSLDKNLNKTSFPSNTFSLKYNMYGLLDHSPNRYGLLDSGELMGKQMGRTRFLQDPAPLENYDGLWCQRWGNPRV